MDTTDVTIPPENCIIVCEVLPCCGMKLTHRMALEPTIDETWAVFREHYDDTIKRHFCPTIIPTN